MLDSVKNTRKIGEERFEQIHKQRIASVKGEDFVSIEVSSIISAIDKSSVTAISELKKLKIVNELDLHSELI